MQKYCRQKTTKAIWEGKNRIFHKCFSKLLNLRCNQVLHRQSFQSSVTQKAYHTFYDLNCKSKLLIYLMECRICHIQYTGKLETEFNIRLNNHCKDIDRKNALQADQHFKLRKSILDWTSMKIDRNLATLWLKKCDDFWIETLKILHPYSLNAEVNFPNQ